jgi:hypothetical protein
MKSMAIQTNPADTIDQGVANLIEASIADYIDWETLSIQHHIDRDGQAGNWPQIGRDMIEEFKHSFKTVRGKKYVKVIRGNSVHAFIVAVENDNKFVLGDVLKPAGWASPARNKARGNVLLGNYPMQWTGPLYLG